MFEYEKSRRLECFPSSFLIILPTPLMILRRLQTRILFACIKTIRLFFSRAYPNTQNKLNELCIYRNKLSFQTSFQAIKHCWQALPDWRILNIYLKTIESRLVHVTFIGPLLTSVSLFRLLLSFTGTVLQLQLARHGVFDLLAEFSGEYNNSVRF